MSITPTKTILYTAKAHATGGSDGAALCSSNGRLEVKPSVPGTRAIETNAEQLLAAGWPTILKGGIAIPETVNSLYDAETRQAERELSAFISAVTELFDTEQAKLAAEDWLAEFELMDRSPRSVTIATSARLANRLNIARQMLSVTLIDAKVLPKPTSDLFAS
jgi:hypothetical protein